jgi:hypothetical protein
VFIPTIRKELEPVNVQVRPHPLLKLTSEGPHVHRPEPVRRQSEQLYLPGIFVCGYPPPLDPAFRYVVRPKRYRRREE